VSALAQSQFTIFQFAQFSNAFSILANPSVLKAFFRILSNHGASSPVELYKTSTKQRARIPISSQLRFQLPITIFPIPNFQWFLSLAIESPSSTQTTTNTNAKRTDPQLPAHPRCGTCSRTADLIP
jgi:hypothetical protein